MKIEPFGELAVRVIFGDRIDPNIQQKIKQFTSFFDRQPFDGFIEYVPAYTNVVFYYDPCRVAAYGQQSLPAQQQVADYLLRLSERMTGEKKQEKSRKTVHIPVCYGGSFGPDLKEVAEVHHLSAAEVIVKHSEPEYLVYMLGFAPGFPFLGGLPEELATPRRAVPRIKIASGSVGIAGRQTGVYPLDSPGGWQIIGRTPLPLFSPAADPPTLLAAGDLVKFDPIAEPEYRCMKESR